MGTITGSLAVDLVTVIITICICLCAYFTRNFNFWKQHGVTYVQPVPFLGNLKDVMLQKTSIGFFLKKLYHQYKGEKYIGIFSFDSPAVVIRDLDIIKNILVKDSQIFSDRLNEFDENLDPIASKVLFVLKGEKWRYVRHNLSPTFTTGKMKNMFYLVEKCAQEFDKYLDEATAGGSPVEVKDWTAKFTTDVIASCAFGIDSNAIKDPQSEFRVNLRKVFDISPRRAFAIMLSFFAPSLLKLFRTPIVESSIEEFIRRTVWNTLQYREENGIVRKDFLDNLKELRRKNNVQNENGTPNGTNTPTLKMSEDDYAAQALSFLTAGFETSSSTMSFALYELAKHPEIQNRLREEICEILQKHNNEVTYEGIQEMKYLDMVVNETLRKYPILPFLDRKSTAPYDLPSPSGKGTIKIPAGTGVYIPVMGIQYDEDYYPEPEKFDPERFTEENKQNRPNYTHMPFGEGPRICIGMRFGLMQTKTGLIHILSRYKVSPCKETSQTLDLDFKSFLLATKGGIFLSFKRIKS